MWPDEKSDAAFAAEFGARLDARLREPMRPLTHPEVLGKLLPEAVFVPEREHVTNGVPCWCNPEKRDGLVIHRGGT